MSTRERYIKVIESLVNGQEAEAFDLLHEAFVEKAREIWNDLVEADEVVEDEVAEEDNTELHRLRELSGYTNEWVQDSPAQGFSGQERNFIEELCLRMDGVSKSPEGLKWMGKSETWDEGNVLSDKGKLTTVMLWAKKNIDDLYDKMGSEFKVYSDGNDEGDSGRGQSDGNQILQNIIKKIGMVSEDNEDDDRLVSNCCGEYEDDRVTGGLEAGEHGRCSNCHDMAQFIPAKEFHESEEKLDEIDPSRSPWTKSGKHPGAMNREELEKELEVFDELQALGFTLSPKEIMQRDSLNKYLYK